jgi:hypothetical protein
MSTTLELRKVKTNAALSEETIAFSAEVWIDGKYAFDASNHGTGGATSFYRSSLKSKENPGPAARREAELVEQAEAYCKTLAPVESPFDGQPVTMDLELWCNVEIGRIQDRRRIERAAKKAVIFTLPGDEDGSFRSVKCGPGLVDRGRARDYIVKKYPNATIIA